MNTVHRNRKLLVRSALATSSTIAVLIGAQALMMQDAQTDNTAADAAVEQTGQTEQIGQLNNTATTDIGDIGVSPSSTTTIQSGTSSVTPSQSFPQRTRTSR